MAAVGGAVLLAVEGLSAFLPKWLGAEAEVYPQAVAYLRLYALGLPFSTVLAIFAAILRCAGDTRTPLVLNGLANVANVVFNFLFIYPTRTVTLLGRELTVVGAGMEVRGAALGSALALGLAAVLMLVTVLRNRERPLVASPEDNWKPDGAVISQAARLGLPYIGERVTVNLGQILTTALVAKVGTVALAAHQIAITAEAICYLPAYGISFAATALVGQSVGAKSKEDATAYGTLASKLGFFLCVATAALLFFGSEPLARLFTEDEAVIAETARVLRIVSICEPFFSLSIVAAGALRGARDVRWPMLISLATMWGVRIPLELFFLFVMDWRLPGIWWGMTVELIFRGVLCMARWKSGRWTRLSGLDG